MASFSLYAPKLKQYEGGFVNNINDAGGATNCGVTLATFRQFYGNNKTVNDLKKMTNEQWTVIMKSQFWDKMKADSIKNQSVAELCVDWIINSGVSRVKNIQAILGVTADGIVGPQTISAINAANQQQLHFKIKAARMKFYESCVLNRPANLQFYDGWVSRLAAFKYKR